MHSTEPESAPPVHVTLPLLSDRSSRPCINVFYEGDTANPLILRSDWFSRSLWYTFTVYPSSVGTGIGRPAAGAIASAAFSAQHHLTF